MGFFSTYVYRILEWLVEADYTIRNGIYTIDQVELFYTYEKLKSYWKDICLHLFLWLGIISFVLTMSTAQFSDIYSGWDANNIFVLVNCSIGFIWFTVAIFYLIQRIFPTAHLTKCRIFLVSILVISISSGIIFMMALGTNCFPFPFLLPCTFIIYPVTFLVVAHFLLSSQLLTTTSMTELWNFYHLIVMQFEFAILSIIFAQIYQLMQNSYASLSAGILILLRLLMDRAVRWSLQKCLKNSTGKENFIVLSILMVSLPSSAYTIQILQFLQYFTPSIQIALADVFFGMIHVYNFYTEIKLLHEIERKLKQHGIQLPCRENQFDCLIDMADHHQERSKDLHVDHLAKSVPHHLDTILPETENIRKPTIVRDLKKSSIVPIKKRSEERKRRDTVLASYANIVMTNEVKSQRLTDKIKQVFCRRIIPIQADNLTHLKVLYLHRHLRILFLTEYIIFSRYIKLMVSIAFYLLMEIRTYTPDRYQNVYVHILATSSPEARMMRINNYYFIGTQFILTIGISLFISKYVTYSIISQISYMVSKHKVAIIFMCFAWMSCMETIDSPQFGNDITFKKICLSAKSRPVGVQDELLSAT